MVGRTRQAEVNGERKVQLVRQRQRQRQMWGKFGEYEVSALIGVKNICGREVTDNTVEVDGAGSWRTQVLAKKFGLDYTGIRSHQRFCTEV